MGFHVVDEEYRRHSMNATQKRYNEGKEQLS